MNSHIRNSAILWVWSAILVLSVSLLGCKNPSGVKESPPLIDEVVSALRADGWDVELTESDVKLSSKKAADETLEVLAKTDFANVREITLDLLGSESVTDEGLVHVGKIPKIVSLDLSETGVGKDLSHLGSLKMLLTLRFNKIGLNDGGLASLPPLKGLEELYLNGSKITSKSIEHLKAFSALEQLSVKKNESFTESEQDKLEKSNPELTVIVD